MPAIARRAARAASFTAVLGAATLFLSTPALATPVQDGAAPAQEALAPPRVRCSEEVAGAHVCLSWRTDAQGYLVLQGSVTMADGHTMRAGLVSVQGCSPDCRSQTETTGQGVASLTTDEISYGRGTGFYQATATWIDDEGFMHTASAT